MLEASGTVIRAEGAFVWVETQAVSACASCGSSGCTTSVVARFFGLQRNQLRLHNRLGVRIGQEVIVGIPERAALLAALYAYVFPLLAMIGAVALATVMGLGDLAQVGAALGGLWLGIGSASRFVERAQRSPRWAPRLRRVVGPVCVKVDGT
ncbi:MAG: hypothetical protein EA417_18665 [Gammaproteobacteria bacterium]|nr:MAG: hypothetical protein EA417_18665 [Gammaproteobacteria bacterium]